MATNYSIDKAGTYSPADWRASPNFDEGRDGESINGVVIHVAEGNKDDSVGWLCGEGGNNASSAHILFSYDGSATQMVHLADTAWHAGNLAYNKRTVGVEHEGYSAHPELLTDKQLDASAAFVAFVCKMYGFKPEQGVTIIGHNQVPDPYHRGQFGGMNHHSDPGTLWDWASYMNRVNQFYSQFANPLQPSPNAPAGLASWAAPYYRDLATDGLVKCQPFRDPKTGLIVQWTERARFELDDSNFDAAGNAIVTRGLLGNELAALVYPNGFPDQPTNKGK